MTANSLDGPLRTLAKAFVGNSSQDTKQLISTLKETDSDTDLQDAAAFTYAVWKQIMKAHEKDMLGRTTSLNTTTYQLVVTGPECTRLQKQSHGR